MIKRASDRAFAAALFVVALALRLAAALTFAAEPVWDGHYYDFGARRIAAGLGYSDAISVAGRAIWHPWCHYPVGYSGYLAGFYALFGASPLSAHFANGLAGALLAVVTFLLAREALSPARARIAGALVAFHPGLVLYGALVMSEPLAGLLTLASFWVALVVARRSRGRTLGRELVGPAAGALVLGLAALVRPQTLLCAPFLALAAPRPSGRAGLPKLAVGAAVACAVALVPVLPWTARNCRVMDGCALVSTNGGWNLAIGAFPRATGRFETLRSSDGCREVTGQVQQDRCWFAYGLDNIARDPGRWLGLVPKKLAYTFDHESFPVEYLHEARPSLWPEPRRAAGRGVLTAVHRVLVVLSPLAFVALAIARERSLVTPSARRAKRAQAALLAGVALAAILALSQRPPMFWPLVLVACALACAPLPGRPPVGPALGMAVALLATTAATHAIFFGEDRYHVVVTPVLCILVAAALRAPAGWRQEPENTRGADTGGARAAGTSSSE